MRSFTSSSPSWSSLRMRAASTTSSRSSDCSPQGSSNTVSSHVRIQPCSGFCSLIRSSLSISRSTALRTPSGRSRSARPWCGSRRARPRSPEPIWPSSLLDRLELAAQQELALGLLHALLDVGLDPLAQGQVGQDLTGPGDDHAQPGHHVEGLQDLHLLGQGQIGRVAGHVGHPAGLGDVAQALGQPTGTAAHQDVLDHGPVLAGQLGRLVGRFPIDQQLDLDPQGPSRAGNGGAQAGPLDPAHGHCRHAAGQVAPLHHLGHDADRRVAYRR